MTKCLQFKLPTGVSGFASTHISRSIIRKLDKLVNEKKIGSYKTHTQFQSLYVWLQNDHDYTTFFLLWDHKVHWRKATLIEKDFPEDTSQTS